MASLADQLRQKGLMPKAPQKTAAERAAEKAADEKAAAAKAAQKAAWDKEAAEREAAAEKADAERLGVSLADLTRYTKPDAIWAALEAGHVALLSASYLLKLAREGGVLSRRQDLPPEAFICVEELKRLYGKGNYDRALPIIAISFCWDSPQHPDPRGEQLATVAAALEREMPKYAEFGEKFSNYGIQRFTDMGVFWDWASLYQKDPRLFEASETPDAKPAGAEREAFAAALKAGRSFYGGAAYEASRSEDEKAAFRCALHETMDLWYAHQGTTVYMVTQLPKGTRRKVGYEDSGWTTYERRSAEQIKSSSLTYGSWKLVLDISASSDARTDARGHSISAQQKSRKWPLDPGGFDELIESKQFTNGADKGVVKALFRKMSEGQLGTAEKLGFTHMGKMSPPTVRDMEQLGRCLSLCRRLKLCNLVQAGLTDEAGAALFSNIASDAHIEDVTVSENKLGPAAAKAIVGYIRRNASLTEVRAACLLPGL